MYLSGKAKEDHINVNGKTRLDKSAYLTPFSTEKPRNKCENQQTLHNKNVEKKLYK